ncbi:MAG: ligase-associated DNA damage response endonuclease PdeM [Pseudomonadota bacterium]
MKQELALKIGSTTLMLLADKAIFWPEQQALLIADVHFGKAAAYRALGQPVPQGTTTATLKRLDALVDAYRPQQIIFLGDFLHAPKSHAPATLAVLHEWRKKHLDLRLVLVRGNHDIKAGDPPPSLEVEMVNEPYLLGNIALQHIPSPHATHHVVAGHVHPTFRLQGKGRQSLRLPCFHHEPALTLLPSFGDFTGGYAVEKTSTSKVYVTDGSGVWPVTVS